MITEHWKHLWVVLEPLRQSVGGWSETASSKQDTMSTFIYKGRRQITLSLGGLRRPDWLTTILQTLKQDSEWQGVSSYCS